MKLRMFKAQMYKALVWYTQKLSEKHAGQFLSPAKIEEISRDLQVLQSNLQKQETNSVWKVPVKIWAEPTKGHFEVVVADESNVLYLDPE